MIEGFLAYLTKPESNQISELYSSVLNKIYDVKKEIDLSYYYNEYKIIISNTYNLPHSLNQKIKKKLELYQKYLSEYNFKDIKILIDDINEIINMKNIPIINIQSSTKRRKYSKSALVSN